MSKMQGGREGHGYKRMKGKREASARSLVFEICAHDL